LKIEDCKLNICGCRSRSAGACAACRSVLFKNILVIEKLGFEVCLEFDSLEFEIYLACDELSRVEFGA
jgi:hypothetical protein